MIDIKYLLFASKHTINASPNYTIATSSGLVEMGGDERLLVESSEDARYAKIRKSRVGN